ncbi:unnamed protein product [Auanema sp. JU1783]|nr:unnamed protein product [Auanema sp. JU1783]
MFEELEELGRVEYVVDWMVVFAGASSVGNGDAVAVVVAVVAVVAVVVVVVVDGNNEHLSLCGYETTDGNEKYSGDKLFDKL